MADIQRSTELLAALGQEYRAVLAAVRHEIRAAVRQARGHMVDARGDEALAVFADADAAVAAALAIQRAMRAGTWPVDEDVRLRIGLHGGRPTLTPTGYVGLSVHAAARICFAAHGGQLILSSPVRDHLRAPLGDGAGLTDLGRWRFRGLPEPFRLFQVTAPDLDADFPPLRSAVPAA